MPNTFRILALALLTIAAGHFHTVSAQSVPLVGSSSNQAISAVPIDPEHLFVTTIGSGRATHLGKFTLLSPHIAGLVDFLVLGDLIFTAANGDELQTTLDGNLQPFVDETGHVYLIGDVPGTITGGSGRFANATGTFTFSVVFDTATLSSTAEIRGTISYAGK
jgi:hypothetical protein